eukprot:CAMPEP_0172600744 /NCGR_PEP_ID=MMETSP1068-20121228/20896_1 /TAXON_ID=35684 /ORGANISM="Pseudopedinella elastica, Strain CCMP716" /LENGTH=86 /DNA_ID=CAMNT_0013401499 /DNA_START=1 /DNA_END=258 /DNA_ORIENTATION=+
MEGTRRRREGRGKCAQEEALLRSAHAASEGAYIGKWGACFSFFAQLDNAPHPTPLSLPTFAAVLRAARTLYSGQDFVGRTELTPIG